MARANTTEQFIRKASQVHGGKYDYSRVEYVNGRTHVTIICPTHGNFEQSAENHLMGKGCQECGIARRAEARRKPGDQFIREARERHRDKYDYSKVEYVGQTQDVTIICPTHGEFEQHPVVHLQGHGCQECGWETIVAKAFKGTEAFIEEARAVHGDRYDYALVDYQGYHSCVKVICRKHGVFEQLAGGHLRGAGCTKCAGNTRKTTDKFVEQARAMHGDLYDYSQVEYVSSKTVITLVCPKHGSFQQLPSNHLRGHGCEECGTQKTADARRLELTEFLARARQVHGDLYDYSQVEYVGTHCPVQIIPSVHA